LAGRRRPTHRETATGDDEEATIDVKAALRSRDLAAVQKAVSDAPPHEIAAELVRLDGVDQAVLFRFLPKDVALRVFEELASSCQRALLDDLRAEEVADVVEHLEPDDRARLLGEVPAKVAARLLEQISSAERQQTTLLLGYPPESAGRIMTPDYVTVRAEMTAAEAIDRVRHAGVDAETVYVLYVLDGGRRLVGVATLKDVVLAAPDAAVDSFMTRNPVCVSTDEDQEAVARRLIAYDLMAVAVVDRERRLVGIVTLDDALDVLEREDTEDVERIGGGSPLDQPYLTASVARVYRARIGWLLVLFVAEAFTGTVLRSFETTLQSVVALSFFVPLLLGTGGNVGSQTTTTIVRAMAVGEVQFRDALRVMWKEMRVGLLLGLTMAAVGMVRAATWGTGANLALVVGCALVSIVLLATFVGSLLPITLKRLRLDPAVVSAPFITTLVDAVGLLIYLLLAEAILGR
jgi:magnesium transporter